MTKKLLAQYNGLTEYVHIDPMKPDDLTIETVQDCTNILEDAKHWRDYVTPGKDLRHVACIPNYFVDKAAREGWLHDNDKWYEFLNNPDNKMFRTWPGRVGRGGQH